MGGSSGRRGGRAGAAGACFLALAAAACGSEPPVAAGDATVGTDAGVADGPVTLADAARSADATADTGGGTDATPASDGAADAVLADAAARTIDAAPAADSSKIDVVVSGAKLLINELAAMGTTSGTFNPGGGDWIEVWNGTPQAVDLAGYRTGGLGPGFAGATALPKVVVAPNGYQLIYFNHEAKGFPVIDKKLKSDGGIGVWEPSGKPVDLLDWLEGDSPVGKSWGRSPDGSATFKTFDKPTPGAANP